MGSKTEQWADTEEYDMQEGKLSQFVWLDRPPRCSFEWKHKKQRLLLCLSEISDDISAVIRWNIRCLGCLRMSSPVFQEPKRSSMCFVAKHIGLQIRQKGRRKNVDCWKWSRHFSTQENIFFPFGPSVDGTKFFDTVIYIYIYQQDSCMPDSEDWRGAWKLEFIGQSVPGFRNSGSVADTARLRSWKESDLPHVKYYTF